MKTQETLTYMTNKNTRTKKTNKTTPATPRTLSTKSRYYGDFAAFTRTFDVRTSKVTKAGVRVSTTGSKKLTTVEILIPSTTIDGDNRVVKVTLTGRQAKAVYDTMERHYNTY